MTGLANFLEWFDYGENTVIPIHQNLIEIIFVNYLTGKIDLTKNL